MPDTHTDAEWIAAAAVVFAETAEVRDEREIARARAELEALRAYLDDIEAAEADPQ